MTILPLQPAFRRPSGLWCAAVVLCFVTMVHAGESAQLVGPDLQARTVTLQSLRGAAISFFDADRAYQHESVSHFLQLRLINAKPTKSDEGVLILTDGQRYRGRWLGGANEQQAIRWEHELFGEMIFDIEQIAGWQAAGEDGRVAPGSDDRVVLVNGDVMRGFVVAVSGEGVSVQIQLEGGPQTLQLGIAQVRRVDLANPAVESHTATGRTAHLIDGTQARVVALSIEDDRVALQRSVDDESVSMPLGALLRVDFPSRDRALRDLAVMPMTLTGGGEVFAMPLRPRTEGTDVLLHAPMTVTFELPKGAQRFAAEAVLDVDPHDPVAWAGFGVIVRAGSEELARYALSANQASVDINLSVAGATTLTLELDASFNGPVMDRLRLRDAAVLYTW